MEKVFSLLSLFTKENSIEVYEDFWELRVRCATNNINVPDADALENRVKFFPSRDNVIIDVKLDNDEPVSYHFNGSANEFLDDVDIIKSIKDEDSVFCVTIVVQKEINSHNELSVYNSDTFFLHVKSLTFAGIIYSFGEALADRESILFRLQEPCEFFGTYTFYFCGEVDKPKMYCVNREEIISNRNEVASFLNAAENKFVPEDFILIKRASNKEINDLFDRLSLIYCLLFLSNISSLKDDLVYCKLNGYRTIEKEYEYTSIHLLAYEDYLSIYKWTYNEGNLNDKIGLSRNVISLQAKENDFLKLENGTFFSVKSNYEIYLKKNLEKYIDIKNKLSEMLMDISKKYSQAISEFSSSLKKNFIVLLTFFVTVIIRGLLSGQNNKVFTQEIKLVSYVVLGISVAYLGISIFEICRDINRIKVNYNRLKLRYADILEKNDIERIFNYDKDNDDEIDYVTNNTIAYSVIWILVIIIGCSLIYCL